MTQITPYSNVISARSRRLRLAGVALLVVLLLMSLYGIFAVMPAMRNAAALYHAASEKAIAQQASAPVESAKTLRRVHRLMGIKLLFTDAYWLTCGLLAFAAMVVAWLDFREVARRYQSARTAIWQDSASAASTNTEWPDRKRSLEP